MQTCIPPQKLAGLMVEEVKVRWVGGGGGGPGGGGAVRSHPSAAAASHSH